MRKIDPETRELIKEYRKVRRRKPENFAELIEGSVC